MVESRKRTWYRWCGKQGSKDYCGAQGDGSCVPTGWSKDRVSGTGWPYSKPCPGCSSKGSFLLELGTRGEGGVFGVNPEALRSRQAIEG